MSPRPGETAAQGAARVSWAADGAAGGVRRRSPRPARCLQLIPGEAHLRTILAEYQVDYNTARPHQGIAQRVPDGEHDGGLTVAGLERVAPERADPGTGIAMRASLPPCAGFGGRYPGVLGEQVWRWAGCAGSGAFAADPPVMNGGPRGA